LADESDLVKELDVLRLHALGDRQDTLPIGIIRDERRGNLLEQGDTMKDAQHFL
jgi:hypothetical protein